MMWTSLLQNADAWDRGLFLRLVPYQPSPLGRAWNRWFSELANGRAYFVLGLLPWLSAHPAGAGFALAMALGFAIELPAYKGLKARLKRPRPCDAMSGTASLLPIPDLYSFPSGHTAGAFVLAGTLLRYFPLWAPLAYAFALCVAYSRVYNRLHYPADTLAGALLGTLCASLGSALSRILLEGPA